MKSCKYYDLSTCTGDHKGDFTCFEEREQNHRTSEAVVRLNNLLVAQAKLIAAVWKMAEEGLIDDSEHGIKDSTLRNIVDKIKAVMLTGN